jgi:hypothetical protein
MNYVNIKTDNIEELKNLRDIILKEMEDRDKEEIYYQKLSEDLWDLNDKINRIESK